MRPSRSIRWVGLALFALSAGARSAPPRTRLEWRSDPRCLSAEELRERVDARLGEHVFAASESAVLDIRGEVGQTPQGGWTARVSAATAAGELLGSRVLDSPAVDCRALDERISLVVALMIDPDALARPAPPALPPARGWTWGALLSGGAGAGLEPGLQGFLGVGIQAQPPGWPLLELGADLWSRGGLSAGAGEGASFAFGSAALRACPSLWRGEAVTWSACAGLGGGALAGRGSGFDSNASALEARADFLAGLRFSYRWGHWFVDAGGEGAIPWVRPQFVYQDASGVPQLIYRPPAGAFAARIGVGYRFDHN